MYINDWREREYQARHEYAFTARISCRHSERTNRWGAACCLTNGSIAASGETREQAIENLMTKIPVIYKIQIEPDRK